eukprot:11183924-Lingulodinium_polyedra.AAC.1
MRPWGPPPRGLLPPRRRSAGSCGVAWWLDASARPIGPAGPRVVVAGRLGFSFAVRSFAPAGMK